MSEYETFHMSLLDMLAFQAQCVNLSDLHCLKQWERARLARKLANVPPDAAILFEWNDALEYLARDPPQQTPQAARARLIASLGGQLWDKPGSGISSKEEKNTCGSAH